MIRSVAVLLATSLLLPACASTGYATLDRAAKIRAFEATYKPTEGDSYKPAYDDLAKRLTSWGFTIHDLNPMLPYWGVTDRSTKSIHIRRDVPVNAQFEILCHEAAHTLQPPAFHNSEESQRQTAEVFAELVAQGVARHYNIDVTKGSESYLSSYKHLFAAARWMKVDIELAIALLTGQLPAPKFTEEYGRSGMVGVVK